MKGLLEEEEMQWDVKEEAPVQEVANSTKDNVAYGAIGWAAWAMWS